WMGTYLAAMLPSALRHGLGADVLFVQQVLYPAAALALVSLASRRPLVVCNQGSGEVGGVRLMQRLPLGAASLKLLGQGATGISPSAGRTAEMKGAGFSRVAYIPHGVPIPPARTEASRAAARARLELYGPCALFLGHFNRQKTVDLLVRAFREVQAAGATLL